MEDHRTGALTTLAKALSTLGSQALLMSVVLVVVGALIARRRGALALALPVRWGGAILLSTFAKQIVDRPRPPRELWLQHAAGRSFPSGHAVQSLSTFVVLGIVGAAVAGRARRAVILVAGVLAVGVAWSRVYLGVHWTTDVLAGLLAAAAWTAAVYTRAT